MIDINLIRTNPQLVKENIKKKFQDAKLPLVDEVLALDEKKRALQREGDDRLAKRNEYAKKIGADFYAKDAKESCDIAKKVFESIGNSDC